MLGPFIITKKGFFKVSYVDCCSYHDLGVGLGTAVRCHGWASASMSLSLKVGLCSGKTVPVQGSLDEEVASLPSTL